VLAWLVPLRTGAAHHSVRVTGLVPERRVRSALARERASFPRLQGPMRGGMDVPPHDQYATLRSNNPEGSSRTDDEQPPCPRRQRGERSSPSIQRARSFESTPPGEAAMARASISAGVDTTWSTRAPSACSSTTRATSQAARTTRNRRFSTSLSGVTFDPATGERYFVDRSSSSLIRARRALRRPLSRRRASAAARGVTRRIRDGAPGSSTGQRTASTG